MPRLAARLDRLTKGTDQARPKRIYVSRAAAFGLELRPGETTKEQAAAEVARLEAEGFDVLHIRIERVNRKPADA